MWKKLEKEEKKIKIGDNEYKLSDFHTQKTEILEELKKIKYNDIGDLAYRMQLTYNEIIDILDLEYIPTKRIGYSLNPGVYEVIDLNNMFKYILPDNVKVTITIDDIRLKSKLKVNQTLIFTNKSFFYTILGFTQSHAYPLDDIEGFYQILPGSYEGDRPINIMELIKFT